MAAQDLSLGDVAQQANLNIKSVMAVRKGSPNVGLLTLKAVLDVLGLTLHEVSAPKPVVAADDTQTAASV